MRPSRASSEPDDAGSAAIEFILVGVVLLVPIVYLIVMLGAVQQTALGVEATSRHLARAIATSPDAGEADARAAAVTAALAEEYGMAALEVDVACSPPATACPEAGATLTVRVSSTVALPFVPPVWGLDRFARIPVEAIAVQKVSRYWGSG